MFGKIEEKMFSETIKYVNITHLILNSEAAAIKYQHKAANVVG